MFFLQYLNPDQMVGANGFLSLMRRVIKYILTGASVLLLLNGLESHKVLS